MHIHPRVLVMQWYGYRELVESNHLYCIVNPWISDIDECTRYRFCQNGATCVNTQGHFTCTCQSGWKGTQCQTGICDIWQIIQSCWISLVWYIFIVISISTLLSTIYSFLLARINIFFSSIYWIWSDESNKMNCSGCYFNMTLVD
jgi:hypothetical protein